jgi:UDP-N-acetyl-2-amino-2-deoxyglucuronate dehydrogenase
MPKAFALIGVAGYIAPKHMNAIKQTGNELVAALDPKDSVGIIDSYFPKADFFVEFERFDRHIDKLRRKNKQIDYVSICSPNYLHDAHIRFALRSDANAICEKPLVLNPWNLAPLKEIEKESGRSVFTILQLRLHPAIIALREKVQNTDRKRIYDIDLTYITARGNWYFISWKGDLQKSGGITTNIGIHFFDMLIWIFGSVKKNIVHLLRADKAAGFLELDRARVRWFLSTDESSLPEDVRQAGQSTYRSIKVGGEEIEFSGGFTDLHTASYQQILSGRGFGLESALASIETVFQIRNADPVALQGDYHPLAKS